MPWMWNSWLWLSPHWPVQPVSLRATDQSIKTFGKNSYRRVQYTKERRKQFTQQTDLLPIPKQRHSTGRTSKNETKISQRVNNSEPEIERGRYMKRWKPSEECNCHLNTETDSFCVCPTCKTTRDKYYKSFAKAIPGFMTLFFSVAGLSRSVCYQLSQGKTDRPSNLHLSSTPYTVYIYSVMYQLNPWSLWHKGICTVRRTSVHKIMTCFNVHGSYLFFYHQFVL